MKLKSVGIVKKQECWDCENQTKFVHKDWKKTWKLKWRNLTQSGWFHHLFWMKNMEVSPDTSCFF